MGTKTTQKCYLATIIIFAITIYFFLVFTPWIKKIKLNKNDWVLYVFLILTNLSSFFYIWSMITTIVIDPGDPEVFWVK